MAPESEHNEHHPTKTEERLPGVDQVETVQAAPEITQDLSFSRPQTVPHVGSSAFSHADRASRERIANGLQRQKGNAFVQRIIQRKNRGDAAGHKPTGEEQLVERIQAASPGGQNLDSTVQNQLESGIGADLSSVRVHTGAEVDQLAHSVDATDFTTGQDIFFRAGTYNPSSSQGMHLLAHETAHTVQQSSGPVAGSPAGGDVAVSDPSDPFEQAAEQTAAHITSVARQADTQIQRQAGGEFVQAPRIVSPFITVQRYQAGDTGHGGIEKEALTDVGFTADEASQIYFGNWLRDLSQVPPSVLPLINILALGEFNRPVTQQDLGTYIPSEHLDNPTGGGTLEDRPPYAPAMTDVQSDYACQGNNLSKAQCDAFKDEEHHRADILKASLDSHLPVYIERGKYNAKRILEQAIAARTPSEGRSLMGNALHAIEDYFAHSNFVEAAILTLKKEGVGGKKVDALVDRLKKTTLGEHAVTFDPKTGEPEILTGTYKGKANKTVSELETFKSELEHGQLTRAFMLGLLRQGGIGQEELGKRLGKSAGGAVGGALGGIVGGISGAYQGYEQEKESGAGTVGQLVGGLIGGGRGAISGYRAGEGIGGVIGGISGQAVGYFLDKLAVLGIEAIVAALYVIGIVVDITPLKSLTDAIIEWRVKANTEESRKEAPTDPVTGKKGPSHSELAKDSPDNPLFGASAHLATEVDKEIGIAMQSAWAAGKASSGAPADTKPVTDLVDKFVSIPSHDPWWRTKLLDYIK